MSSEINLCIETLFEDQAVPPSKVINLVELLKHLQQKVSSSEVLKEEKAPIFSQFQINQKSFFALLKENCNRIHETVQDSLQAKDGLVGFDLYLRFLTEPDQQGGMEFGQEDSSGYSR